MGRPRTYKVSVPLVCPPDHHRNLILTFRHDQAACLVRVSLHVVTTTPHGGSLSIDTRTLVLDSPVAEMKTRNNKLMMLYAQHHKDDINAGTGPGWWLFKRYATSAGYEIGGQAR